MKYSKLVLLALLLSVVVMATAQNNDPVVIKINKEEIKLSEFKNTFAKNNNLQTTTKADLDNYIDLYVDFRLKYAEALACNSTPLLVCRMNWPAIENKPQANI